MNMADGNVVTPEQAGLDTLANQPDMQATQPEQIPPYKPAPATPIPQEPAVKPGSFGAKLANALKGFTAAMGDAGAVGQVPEGAGALYGAQKTMQAAQARQKQEQEHKEVLEQQARENTREDWRAMANVATANAQMRHEQALTWQLGEEQMDKSIASGSQMADQWSSLPKAQSQVDAENVTASELTNLIKTRDAARNDKPGTYASTHTAFPTGKKYVGEDKQGKPQYALTYTVMSVPAEYQLTKEDQPWIDVVNKIPGGNQYNIKYDGSENKSDRMPGYVANSLFKQSQTIQAQTAATKKAASDLQLTNEYNTFAPSGEWTKYLGAAKGDIAQAEKHMLADWKSSPDMKQKFPNLHQDIVRMFATKEDPTGQSGYTTALEKQQKDAEDQRREEERETHDAETERILEANNKLKDATKNKYEGNPELLEKYETTADPAEKVMAKQAYRASFPANEMATIDSIGVGKGDVGRLAYLLSRNSNLADAVNFFYPNFDSSKVGGYAEAVKSMTAGKDNIRLRSAGIASKHLLQLYQGTTLGALVPGFEPIHEKESIYNQLAQELASFNAQSNSPGKTEIEDAKKTLGGEFSATWNAKANLRKVASLMADGISEYKTRYKQAAPSPAYETKYSDLSPEAYASLQLVADDGKVTIKDSQGRPYTFTEVAPLAKYMQAKMALEKQQGAQ
jgi:hypothetical protein